MKRHFLNSADVLEGRHSRECGNPWFDRLTMTTVTLSLSKGECPNENLGHDE